ncbi:MAG: ribosome silencing factor [Fimbriimonadaceae bacterium]|nr:ribosome silencing factor [Fimbriimonadaceae bacterium]
MTSQEKVDKIVEFANDIKAEDVEVLDIRSKTPMADFFVVCTGTSDRHVSSIADRVAEKLRELGERPLRVEGETTSWVLHDYGDVWLHVMRDEQRQFYDLETLWKSMHPNPDLL